MMFNRQTAVACRYLRCGSSILTLITLYWNVTNALTCCSVIATVVVIPKNLLRAQLCFFRNCAGYLGTEYYSVGIKLKI